MKIKIFNYFKDSNRKKNTFTKEIVLNWNFLNSLNRSKSDSLWYQIRVQHTLEKDLVRQDYSFSFL